MSFNNASAKLATVFKDVNTNPGPNTRYMSGPIPIDTVERLTVPSSHTLSEELKVHRERLNRPISRNPFQLDDGVSIVPTLRVKPVHRETENTEAYVDKMSPNEIQMEKTKNLEEFQLASKWINLLFDVAWTATFSNLTNNAQFREPYDSVSYAVFFVTAWWLWVSYVFYSVEFATNDWFHLIVVFLQLILFGALAAATRGFDVTTYILHSPGSDDLYTYNESFATPDQYKAQRLTKISLRVIMIAICISRVLLLIRHLRLIFYAYRTSDKKMVPSCLWIVPSSLVISATLFFVAFRMNMAEYGRSEHGAKVKFVLWGAAILVEAVAQVIRAEIDIQESESGLKLAREIAPIADRLKDITIIILGEGVNAIAGSFFALEQAPGFRGGATGTGVACCAVIRKAAWTMMHLPWLLSVILLLEGVKNQLLLTSFLNAEIFMLNSLAAGFGQTKTDSQLPSFMQHPMLQAGMQWGEEWDKLQKRLQENPATNDSNSSSFDEGVYNDTIGVWVMQVIMKGSFNAFTTFVDDDTISNETQSYINEYLNDNTFPLEDSRRIQTQNTTVNWHIFEILNSLVDPSLINGRYITALCGTTFITLATLNLIQAWPKDRFQWASIFSRYAMGVAMTVLLLINVGESQVYVDVTVPKSQRAGIWKWIRASWAIPTLALSYVTQFVIDTALIYAAARYTRKN
ncbi:hypothetical protein FRC09_006441 [Ceratobasidium sp. 395]|nr:hypothetical protein FRC09_006441 [Ceratobasidium sp. 395]